MSKIIMTEAGISIYVLLYKSQVYNCMYLMQLISDLGNWGLLLHDAQMYIVKMHVELWNWLMYAKIREDKWDSNVLLCLAPHTVKWYHDFINARSLSIVELL